MKSKFRWRFQEKLMLFMCDGIIYGLLTSFFYISLVSQSSISDLFYSPGYFFILANLLGWNYVFGNYEIEITQAQRKTLLKSALAIFATLAFVILVNYLTGKQRAGIFGRGVLAGSLFTFAIYLQLSRAALSRLWRSRHQLFKWVFVADPEVKSRVLEDIKTAKLPFSINWVSKANEADIIQESASIFGVVFSSRERDPSLIHTLMNVRLKGLPVYDLIDFYEMYFKKVPVFYLSSEFFSFSKGFTLLGSPLLQRLKRLSDILIAILILIPALPVMALAALLVRLESPGPVIYSQKRSGKDSRDFTLYKFRSMRSDAELKGAQWAQVNDARITTIGKFLRKTRIDELPQLWNILKGDMSFVGPRPERPEFNLQLEEKIPFFQLRHLVRPGLTGWAQINYPYGASIEDSFQKLQYDLYYVKNFSLLLDLQIILKTIRVVVLGQGR